MDRVGTVWEQEGPTSIGNVPVNMIAARGSDGTIAVGTHGNGVYSASLPAAPVGITESAGPISLSAPWPNPATDEVSMMAYLARPERLDVTVFDLNGRVVLQRSLGEHPVGNHRWNWDLRSAHGQRVPTGTYVIQFSTASGARQASRVIVR
jgi:hypothetical protein